jgi:hypothetical protein
MEGFLLSICLASSRVGLPLTVVFKLFCPFQLILMSSGCKLHSKIPYNGASTRKTSFSACYGPLLERHMTDKSGWKALLGCFGALQDHDTQHIDDLHRWGCLDLRKFRNFHGAYEDMVILGLLWATFVRTYDRQKCLESIAGLFWSLARPRYLRYS